MSQKTLIYRGSGARVRYFRGWDARFLTERAFFETPWESTCSLFILPGGQDIYYHATLQGAGNQKIRAFVENGGTFLGICAGAYFASAFVEFDREHPSAICAPRELGFFQGKTVGPLYGSGPYVPDTETGARPARIVTPDGEFYAYYNGGCTFVPFEGGAPHQVLAHYGDLPGNPPAIIGCSIGKGKVILSGVHLETRSAHFKPEDPMFAPLHATDEARHRFLHQVLGSRAQASIGPNTLPPIK